MMKRPFRHLRKLLAWIWTVLLIGVGVNIGSSWLITQHWTVSDTPLGWIIDHAEITLPLTGALLVLTVLARLASVQASTIPAQLSAPPTQRLPLQEITGTWIGKDNGGFRYTISLIQTGNAITGTGSISSKDFNSSYSINGFILDDSIEFTGYVSRTRCDQEATLSLDRKRQTLIGSLLGCNGKHYNMKLVKQ